MSSTASDIAKCPGGNTVSPTATRPAVDLRDTPVVTIDHVDHALRVAPSEADPPEALGDEADGVGDADGGGDDDEIRADALLDVHAGEKGQHHRDHDDRAPRRHEGGQRVAGAEDDREEGNQGAGEIADAHDQGSPDGPTPPLLRRGALTQEAPPLDLRLLHFLLRAQGDVGAGRHRERPGDGRRGSGDQDGHRVPEGTEEPADRPQDLDQAVVQPEQEVPDPFGVDLALGQTGHDLVLVLEFVLQDLPDRPPQGASLVGLPDRQILPPPVDLDGFQHQMRRPRPEDPADPDEEPELDAAPQIEGADFDPEELLPEGEVLRLQPQPEPPDTPTTHPH